MKMKIIHSLKKKKKKKKPWFGSSLEKKNA